MFRLINSRFKRELKKISNRIKSLNNGRKQIGRTTPIKGDPHIQTLPGAEAPQDCYGYQVTFNDDELSTLGSIITKPLESMLIFK